MTDLVQILSTGHIYQADMASLALKEAGVPHFLREETASGLRMAMPVSPSMGPGVWFVLQAPRSHADRAQAVVSALPFDVTREREVWVTPSRTQWMKLNAWVAVLLLVLLGIFVWLEVHGF